VLDYFFLSSNSGGHTITKKALEHWRKGLNRKDLVLKDIESAVTLSAFNEDGLSNSNMLAFI